MESAKESRIGMLVTEATLGNLHVLDELRALQIDMRNELVFEIGELRRHDFWQAVVDMIITIKTPPHDQLEDATAHSDMVHRKVTMAACRLIAIVAQCGYALPPDIAKVVRALTTREQHFSATYRRMVGLRD